MKKKKYQATEQHLIGRDQEMKKKLEFVKTQGTFLRKVLASIEWQTKWTQYIIGCFERSAIQFPIKESSDETTDDAREWASLSDLKRIKQLWTQEQMKEICQSIVNDMNSNKSYIPPRSVVINFENETLQWHDMLYTLDDSVIDHGSPQAFLKATGDDGNDYFFELTHFSMLYLLDSDIKALGTEAGSENVEPAPTQSSDVDNKKEQEQETDSVKDLYPDMDVEDGRVGMFTLFSAKYDMLFVTTY